jgi:steroid 5-alpha reductase family enzyme
MLEPMTHAWLVWTEIGLAGVTLCALVFLTAPYGRHGRAGWGPKLPARWGWVLMECPSVIYFAALYLQGQHRSQVVNLVFFAMWQLHYVNRTFVFPFRLRGKKAAMPLLIALTGFSFNMLNATINAWWIGHLGTYGVQWLWEPYFIIGSTLFVFSWLGNLHSDAILRNLRKPGESGYKIPEGGLYRWVSCPNYLCEILQWCGWALATWSGAGIAFALYTLANLAPRALSHHRWYRERFDSYPSKRRALFPYLL